METEYYSRRTGEIVTGARGVFHAIMENLFYYHFLDISWKRFDGEQEPMSFIDTARRWGF